MKRFIAVAACAALILGSRAEAGGGRPEQGSTMERGATGGSGAEAETGSTAEGAGQQDELGQDGTAEGPTARPGTFTEAGTGLGTRHDTALGKSGVSARDPTKLDPVPEQGGARWLTGTVESFDEDSLAVRSDAGETRDLSVNSDTRFLRDGREISRDEINEGDQVRAAFSGPTPGELAATEIQVMGGSSGESGSGAAERTGSGSPTELGTGGGAEGTRGAGGADREAETGLETPPRR